MNKLTITLFVLAALLLLLGLIYGHPAHLGGM